MANSNKIDLEKIKGVLEERKKESAATRPAELNIPKDNFLFELETSLRSGNESRATNRIKLIENKASVNTKGAPIHDVKLTQPTQSQARPQAPRGIGEDAERDELMYREFNNKVNTRNSGLSTAINEFAGQNQKSGTPQMLNEEYINEAVNKRVVEYLNENLGAIFEEAIKETMLEMFAREHINSVLGESKDTLKTLLREIINENKAKANK